MVQECEAQCIVDPLRLDLLYWFRVDPTCRYMYMSYSCVGQCQNPLLSTLTLERVDGAADSSGERNELGELL